MSDCLFCQIIDKKIPADIVFEDDKVLVFHDISPKASVHLLMIPKIHLKSLAELSPENDELISHMMRLLPKIADKFDLTTGFRTIINTGKEGGQVVFHLHLHLLGGALPRFE